MPRNVEIKARVFDPNGLRRRVESIADRGPVVLHQEDTFFPCATGRLKLRRLSEREGELIFYQRPDEPGPTLSRYTRAASHEPETLIGVLSQALGVRGVVSKRRTVYWAGRTRLHVDEVVGLGTFLELEVVLEPCEPIASGMETARAIMNRLEIREPDLVDAAYIDLLETSRPPGRGGGGPEPMDR